MAPQRPARSAWRASSRAAAAAAKQAEAQPSRLQRAVSSVKRLVKRLTPQPPRKHRIPVRRHPAAALPAAPTVLPPSGPTAPPSPALAPAAPAAAWEQPFEMPTGYHHTQIVVLVRDPWWLFSYWEVTPATEQAVRQTIPPQEREGAVAILRVYDVTNGEAGAPSFDILLRDLANNWYIHVGQPDRAWIVEIGLRTSRGAFYRLARSNRVTTPRHGPSDVIDEEWMSLEEDYWKLFGVAGGFGIGKSSMEIRQRFREQLQQALSSGAVSSFGASPVKRAAAARGFWCRLEAELIVYGATEPDARVTLQGQPVRLRPDGTFSVRMALPDGQQNIPVQFTSGDGVDTRTIAPLVTRRTDDTDPGCPSAAAQAQPSRAADR